MEPAASAAITRDFDDNLNNRWRALGFGVAVAILIPALIMAVRNSERLMRDHHATLVLLCWILLLLILFALPRMIREFIQAFQGMPALRIGERGIWSRRWSHLGWIAWADIAAVVVVSTWLGEEEIHELDLDLRTREYTQLTWNDRVAGVMVWLLGYVLGTPSGLRTLPLVTSLSLAGSWDDLMAALDPILAARGVRKREDPAGALQRPLLS
jgi:hypothetical protein